MEAKSKFNIGDVIYFYHTWTDSDGVHKGSHEGNICGISFFAGTKNKQIIIGTRCFTASSEEPVIYHLKECVNIPERFVYATEEELSEAFAAAQGNEELVKKIVFNLVEDDKGILIDKDRTKLKYHEDGTTELSDGSILYPQTVALLTR